MNPRAVLKASAYLLLLRLHKPSNWQHQICALLLAILTGTSFALDARQVFETVAPSTVLIEDVDSFGSGVFLNNKGLILTNYHVVAANIALKVRARVKFGNRVVLTELDNVKVTKIHRSYDLALLEVKPPSNGTFIPAQIVPITPPLSTGIKCFAIGNPGGPNGKALELTITEGLVSAAFRKMDDLEYTQISAQINPGNSGGPICDEHGRVIGITTWKMTDTEGIGFAIPTQRMNMVDFIDPKEKKPDMALAARAEAAGKKYYNLAQLADRNEKQLLLLACAEAYRVYMLANPNSILPYDNLSIIYYALGEHALAKNYSEAAMRIMPDDPRSCHTIGIIALEPDKQNVELAAKCVDLWFRGLMSSGDKEARSVCAGDIAITMVNQQKWNAGAYMLQWAEILIAGEKSDLGKNTRERLWVALQQRLPAPELEAIRSKNEGFSPAEFASLAAGKPFVGTSSQRPSTTNGTVSSQNVPSVALPAATQAQVVQIVEDATTKFAPKQISIPPEGLDCALPDVAGKAVLAYAGWEVVISFPELMKLGIFNLATCKLDGFIDCADRDPLVAASGQILAIYSQSNQLLEIYDLGTRQKTMSKPLGLPGPVAFLGMGMLNPERIFVLYNTKNKQGVPFLTPVIVTLPDLKSFELLPEIKDNNNPFWNMPASPNVTYEGSVDDAGNMAAVVPPTDYPSSLGYYAIKDGNKIAFSEFHNATKTPRFAFGGRIVVGKRGLLDPNSGGNPYSQIEPHVNPYAATPVLGFPAFVVLESKSDYVGFRIFGLPAMNAISKLPVSKEKANEFFHAEFKNQVETLLASAYCDRFAYLLPAAKKIVVFPLGLKGGGAGSGFAEPGKHFERKLSVTQGATVAVQSGPPGLKYETTSGTLVWDVPADVKTGQVISVILLIREADTKENYVVEKISIP